MSSATLLGLDRKILSLRIALHHEQLRLFEIVKTDKPERWQAIRDIYRLQYQICGEFYEAYPVDWTQIFTPIERECWNSMRVLGGLPFYPQYPVGPYFVDFGDPVRRIALECDGKNWHDLVKDARRDAQLRTEGWLVYRMTGRQCMLPDEHPESAYRLLADIGSTFYARWPGQYSVAANDEDMS